MIARRTSIEAYYYMVENNLLSKRRLQTLEPLVKHGDLTASQIANYMPGNKSESVGANVHARLGELRERGTVIEKGYTLCPITGRNVILWSATGEIAKEPLKPTTIKCPHCNGQGKLKQERLL